MQIYKTPYFTGYFGGAQDQFFPNEYKQLSNDPGGSYPAFAQVCNTLKIDKPLFLHQVHGADGAIIFSKDQAHVMRSFSQDGDYLITDVAGVGIGVVTGDCLPIFFYDPDVQAVAAVHAGWRGSVQKVALKAVEQMRKEFGSNLRKIKAIFGPCGHTCCYEVSEEFLDNLEPFSFVSEVIHRTNQGLFFDLVRFNQLLLLRMGLELENIDLSTTVCTICNQQYYSHRRQGSSAGRNMNVIMLGQ